MPTDEKPKRVDASNSLTLYPKTTATATAGSVSLVLIWCLHQYAHVDFPPEVAAAITLIISSVATWLAPPSKS